MIWISVLLLLVRDSCLLSRVVVHCVLIAATYSTSSSRSSLHRLCTVSSDSSSLYCVLFGAMLAEGSRAFVERVSDWVVGPAVDEVWTVRILVLRVFNSSLHSIHDP